MRYLQFAIAASLLTAPIIARAQPQVAVSGRVLTASGAPLQGKNHFILIAHGDDHDNSTSGTYPIEDDGSFHCDLPPGRYLAAAVDYLEEGEETNPDTLERLRNTATPFTLEEGDTKALTLKVVTQY